MTRGSLLFFFNDTATTEIYTLSLHDALPICHGAAGPARHAGVGDRRVGRAGACGARRSGDRAALRQLGRRDRKSTRLNSSYANISYAVFCLKKKKKTDVSTIIAHTDTAHICT